MADHYQGFRNASEPLRVTARFVHADADLTVYDSSNEVVASSLGFTDVETIGFSPIGADNYRIVVSVAGRPRVATPVYRLEHR